MCIQENIMICRLICALLLATKVALLASDDTKKALAITIERTTCYGTCPAYKVTIHGDGSLLYEGRKDVRVVGTQESTISPEAVSKLAQAFLKDGYFELRDNYPASFTDGPTTYTSIAVAGRHKVVEDHGGAPEKLRELESEIDEIAGSKRWIYIDPASVHEEAKHGWNVRSVQAQQLLLHASEEGDADVVRAFIAEGADVNSHVGPLTPLQRARGVEVVKALIAAGADVNATSKTYFGPPLNFAAELGDAESVHVLIGAGAKVNGRSPDGETALMNAARSGNPAAVHALLSAGANIHTQNANGEDAWNYLQIGLAHQEELAKRADSFEETTPNYVARYKEIAEMLKVAGALEANRSAK
jgi:hypothetical protein